MKKLVALAAISTLVLSGCSFTLLSATGGGWMENAGEDGKATFGFDITCNEADGYLYGSWVYHDRKNDPKINAHGSLSATSGGWDGGVKCRMRFTSEPASLELSYRAAPCPRTGTCIGNGTVWLEDSGDIGRFKDDQLTVEFLTGPYAGYENDKTAGGGNLKVVKD